MFAPILRWTALILITVAIAAASLVFADQNLVAKPLWHVAGFGFLMLAVLGTAIRRSPRRVGVVPPSSWLLGGVVATVAILLEVAQWALLEAPLEKRDVVANLLGCALGAIVWLLLRRRHIPRSG